MGAGGKTKLKFKAVGSGCSEKIQLAYVQFGRVADWTKVPANDFKEVTIDVKRPANWMSKLETYNFSDDSQYKDENGVF